MGPEPILHASVLHQPGKWYEHTSYPDKSAKLYPVMLNLVEVIPSFMKNQSQRKRCDWKSIWHRNTLQQQS